MSSRLSLETDNGGLLADIISGDIVAVLEAGKCSGMTMIT